MTCLNKNGFMKKIVSIELDSKLWLVRYETFSLLSEDFTAQTATEKRRKCLTAETELSLV